MTEIPAGPRLLERHHLGALTALQGTPEVKLALKDQLARAAMRWAQIARELPPLVARFGDAGVGIAPIKGVAYAMGLYATPAARPMSDVDLLVEPGREPQAYAVLAAAGFERQVDIASHHASTWVRGDLNVDLHRNILGSGRSHIDLHAVWSRAIPGWPAGARRLEPTDELVFHLAHMARNRLSGPLVQIVDASYLIERTDAGKVRARARQWQIGALIDAALDYCQSVLTGEPLLWPARPWAPSEPDVLYVRQPGPARKLVYDVATAGSPRQLAARAIGAGFQWLARHTRTMVRRP